MCANVEDAKILKNLYLECACKFKRCKDVEELLFCLKPTQMCKQVGVGKSRITMAVMNKIWIFGLPQTCLFDYYILNLTLKFTQKCWKKDFYFTSL